MNLLDLAGFLVNPAVGATIFGVKNPRETAAIMGAGIGAGALSGSAGGLTSGTSMFGETLGPAGENSVAGTGMGLGDWLKKLGSMQGQRSNTQQQPGMMQQPPPSMQLPQSPEFAEMPKMEPMQLNSLIADLLSRNGR